MKGEGPGQGVLRERRVDQTSEESGAGGRSEGDGEGGAGVQRAPRGEEGNQAPQALATKEGTPALKREDGARGRKRRRGPAAEGDRTRHGRAEPGRPSDPGKTSPGTPARIGAPTWTADLPRLEGEGRARVHRSPGTAGAQGGRPPVRAPRASCCPRTRRRPGSRTIGDADRVSRKPSPATDMPPPTTHQAAEAPAASAAVPAGDQQ